MARKIPRPGGARTWPAASARKIMRTSLLVLISAFFLVTGCSHPSLENNGSKDVGITGNVKTQHESLGSGRHMLVVTAAPALAETEGSIEQRIFIQAQREASRICPGRFEFVNNPNGTAPLAAGFMKRSRTADAADRIEQLQELVRTLLRDVIPHAKYTGHTVPAVKNHSLRAYPSERKITSHSKVSRRDDVVRLQKPS